MAGSAGKARCSVRHRLAGTAARNSAAPLPAQKPVQGPSRRTLPNGDRAPAPRGDSATRIREEIDRGRGRTPVR